MTFEKIDEFFSSTSGDSLKNAFEELSYCPNPSEKIDKFASFFAVDPYLRWVAGGGEAQRVSALSKLTHFVGDKRLIDDSLQSLAVRVSAGERARLTCEFPASINRDCVFAHYLFKLSCGSTQNPVIAVRWFHGAEDEEVVFRVRASEVVIGKSIAASIDGTRLIHLTVGRVDGKDLFLLNGKVEFYKTATTSLPTGVTFDLIGTDDETIGADFLFFQVDSGVRLTGLDEAALGAEFINRLSGAIRSRDLDSLDRILYAFSGLDKSLPIALINQALELNLNSPLGYRDYLSHLLVQRIDRRDLDVFERRVSDSEPSPVISIEDVSVTTNARRTFRFLPGSGTNELERGSRILEKISFKAYSGDIIGIIGKNGAGKSTLLRTLVGAMPISSGFIGVNGDPILLRPGAGMQGDLTGRENILKAGIYMGMSPAEIAGISDEIIEFSELHNHIDRPFRHYSDGMRARLIFSLATAIPRDILLLDELLSAGDMGFQQKAISRLEAFISRSKLVLVVQHTFDFILARCNKCLLLEGGKMKFFGNPKICIELYKESL